MEGSGSSGAESPAGFEAMAPSAPSAPPQQVMSEPGLKTPLLQACAQQAMTMQPWEVGPQNMYAPASAHPHFAPPYASIGAAAHGPTPEEDLEWMEQRRVTLLEWGRKREDTMHRRPKWLMDQMVSGSGLYPPRLLDDTWFTPHELDMIHRLEALLSETMHGQDLARDMLAPLIYDVDVRIVVDDSGSMNCDMFGTPTRGCAIEEVNYVPEGKLADALSISQRGPAWRRYAPAVGGIDPGRQRWYFARDALRKWRAVYSILGLDPAVYVLNPPMYRCRLSEADQIFLKPPRGTTPMDQALNAAIRDHQQQAMARPLFILALTDGEANDMQAFNRILDEAQNLQYGDVQICLMGLSLVKADIEWFENEECDETRIRTVEAYEVENRQIQYREVVRKEGGYNFAMHSYRPLVTNFFPADYDYEAPQQNIRHRLYITLHGRDRWWGLKSPCCYYVPSQIVCSACFLATCFHGNGWCQGNECGKFQVPDCLEPWLKGE